MTYKLSTMALALMSLSLSACGGSDADKIQKEYDRIEDQVKGEYRRAERNLSDNEQDMLKIIESVFMPEESLDKFVDKLTPEGGKGGLYVGHFVEFDDGDANDIDIGALYFDISKDAAGSVDGRISYQQQLCQDNRTLSTDTAVKIDNAITGKLSGSLDSLKILDMRYIRDLNVETPSIMTTFYGSFDKDATGSPWVGNFQYQDGLGGTKLSSTNANCPISYTLSNRSSFSTYPLDYSRGDLKLAINGLGAKSRLSWQTHANTAHVLVSQININDAESGANGFERNQIFGPETKAFEPVMTVTPTNYAFVVQAFDQNNNLIGYQALVQYLPTTPTANE